MTIQVYQNLFFISNLIIIKFFLIFLFQMVKYFLDNDRVISCSTIRKESCLHWGYKRGNDFS